MTNFRSFVLIFVFRSSVTMDFDFFLRWDALVDEEPEDIASMITLQLDDITPLAMFGCRSIAAPRFFKVARQLLHVQVIGQTTHRCQTLTSISFLKVQMHEIVTGYLAFLATLSSTTSSGGCVEWIIVIQDEHVIISFRFFTHIAVSLSHRLVLSRCHIPTNKLIY